jgi:hypothetical protein
MITVHRRLSTRWIKLSDEDDEEFLIRPPNSPTMLDIRNEISVDEETGNILISGRGVMAACRFGLLDWKGIKDEKGEDLPFSSKLIAWLPADHLKMLAAKIIKESQLSESERKNS